MKADFKDGVSKAAGKLSSLASTVMSSIQVRIKTREIFFSFTFIIKNENIFYRENKVLFILNLVRIVWFKVYYLMIDFDGVSKSFSSTVFFLGSVLGFSDDNSLALLSLFFSSSIHNCLFVFF